MAKKLPKKIDKAIKDYIEVLKKDISIQEVILYGSYAKERGKINSDVDLAIISNEFGKNSQQDGKYLFRKLWDVKSAGIEPIGYSPKDFYTSNPSPLLYEIRKYGKGIKV